MVATAAKPAVRSSLFRRLLTFRSSSEEETSESEDGSRLFLVSREEERRRRLRVVRWLRVSDPAVDLRRLRRGGRSDSDAESSSYRRTSITD